MAASDGFPLSKCLQSMSTILLPVETQLLHVSHTQLFSLVTVNKEDRRIATSVVQFHSRRILLQTEGFSVSLRWKL